MAIRPPINIDKASALVPEFQSTQDRFYYIQTTSIPGYDTANPPPDPIPPPLYYDIWYKLSSVRCRGSATVHNLSQGVTAPSYITVYDNNDNVLAVGSTVQWDPIFGNPMYYFKVTTPQTPAAPDVAIEVIWNLVSGGPILASSIVTQDETPVLAPLAVTVGTPAAFNFIRHIVRDSVPTDTNHTLHGKCGDMLPNGTSCIEDRAVKGVMLRNRDYGRSDELGTDGQLSVPLGYPTDNDIYLIKRNGDGRNFWLSYLNSGTPIVRSLAVTGGVLGPIFDLGGKVIALSARADQLLYYVIESDQQVVRIWDIQRNVRLANLTTPTAPIRDIIITSTGDIIVLYVLPTSAHVYRYNAAGTLLSAFERPTVDGRARINYAGSNPSQYVLWTHEPGISLFRWVNLQNGQIYDPVKVKEFNANGGYINVADLYEQKQGNVYLGPTQRVGPGLTNNFWIQPVVSRAGCYVPTPPILDDEFYPVVLPPYLYPDYGPTPELPPGGVYPYPPDPPETPPVIPIIPPPPVLLNPANIGGGLVVVDPDNGVRHDVYQGKNAGEMLQSPIITFVRTAFLGD